MRRTAGRRPIVWLIPSVNVVLKILKNPIYAGAYVWGRSRQTFSYDGDVLRKRRRRVPPSEAKVLIRDHHAAYITWDRYESNVARLADNLARWEKRMGGEGRGAARRGTALLPGLLRCGQCGRRLRVTYSPTPMYRCSGGQSAQKGRCFRLGAIGLDRAVGQQLCRALQPAALEAIVAAEELRRDEHQGRVDQAHLSVRAAQYEVDRALEQYDSVDPKNRLVAETLEERLNVRLTQLRTTQEQYERLRDSWEPLSDAQRTALRALGENFERAWNHPAADAQLKTRIVRAAIEDIIVTPSSDDSTIEVVIHWSGGTHTTCRVHRARSGRRGGPATGDLVDAVRELASYVADEDTARILNVNGYTTPRNLPWTLDRVRRFRKSHQLCLGQPDPDTVTMTTAAEYLGVANDVVRRLAQKQLFSKRQVMPYAPWRVSKAELDTPRVRTAAERLSATTKSSPDGAQLPLLDNPVH